MGPNKQTPGDDDLCARCHPPHAWRDHDRKWLQWIGSASGHGDKRGICLVAGCLCNGFVPAPQEKKDKPQADWLVWPTGLV